MAYHLIYGRAIHPSLWTGGMMHHAPLNPLADFAGLIG